MFDEFDRSLERAEIAEILHCDLNTASAVLTRFGCRCGGWYVIGQREFRLLMEDGSIAEFISQREKRKFRRASKDDTAGEQTGDPEGTKNEQ